MSNADAIILQEGYSTDIHLFRIGQPDATGALIIGQSTRVKIGLLQNTAVAASIPAIKAGVTYDTTQNTRATTQPFMTFDVQPTGDPSFMWLIFTVVAGANSGEVYCRVSNGNSPSSPDYSNLIFRVTVHDSLTRFWLGNRRLTLFNGSQDDSAEVVVYGECVDSVTTGGTTTTSTSLANLSRHDYVKLHYTPVKVTPPKVGGKASDITIIGGVIRAQLASFTQSTAARGDISVTIGTTKTPPLPGTTDTPTIPIYVVAGTEVARPLLRRFYTGAVADSERKTKLLFLTEGFTSQKDVEPWLTFIKDQFTAYALHSPFDILKDSIDFWTANWLSNDPSPGMTLKSPLTQAGYLVPSYPLVYEQVGATATQIDGRSGLYTINELLTFVGLPNAQAPLHLAGMGPTWTAKNIRNGSKAFNINMVDETLYQAWRRQVPEVVTYAKDTLFGMVKGTYNLEDSSPNELTRADWGTSDPPYFPVGGDRSGGSRFLSRFKAILASLTTPSTAKGYTMTGDKWDIDSKDASAGLVCIIVNDPTFGGVSVAYGRRVRKYLNTMFSIGGRKFYTLAGPGPVTDITFPDPSPLTTPAVPPITVADAAMANAKANIAATAGVATFVHELGHLLGLGDEYGNVYGKHASGKASLATADPEVDRFPNIVTAQKLIADGVATLTDTLITPPAPVPTIPPTTAPAPSSYMSVQGLIKDPATINWNWDRTELASVILTAPKSVAGAAKPTTELRVEAGQNWLGKKNTTVLVRQRALTSGAIDTTLLYPVLLKDVVPVAATSPPAAPTPAYIRLIVEGALPASGSTLAIGKGSVVYVPRYYPALPASTTTPSTAPIKMRLIAEQVANLLKASTFKVTPDVQDCSQADNSQQDPTVNSNAFITAMTTDLANRGITVATPKFPYRIIAIYEGGGEYDCAAYRSSGFSKMRAANVVDKAGVLTEVLPFSYVCQYYLVNKINPTKLAELDGFYDSRTY